MSGLISSYLKRFEEVDENHSFRRKYFHFNISRFINRTNVFQKTHPKAPWAILAFSGIFLWKFFEASRGTSLSEEEIQFRKQQLVQPIYELSSDESVDFPWNEQNLKDWLYRPVKISGRPIHAKAKLIPRNKYGHKGFDYIVPLVTSENPDGSQQKGILLNLGWMPFQWKQVSSRLKVENARMQTFVAYVSFNSELEHSLGLKGNAPILARNKWNSVDLQLMAENSGFENAKKAQIALLEQVNLNTALDERNMEHYNHDASYTQDYPHCKTMAGALQLKTMPWEHKRNEYFYLRATALLQLLGFGLLVF